MRKRPVFWEIFMKPIFQKLFHITWISFIPACLFLLSISVNAEYTFYTQSQVIKEVRGTVSDAFGNVLPGATIIVKGTTIGTASAENGTYVLSNIPDDAVLVFSFIGMITQEVVVGDRTIIDVILVEDVIGLEEVVAIGYGTQKKNQLSGAVTNLTVEDFNIGIMNNAADLLKGKVAGLVITTENGDITRDKTIRLRGVSSLTGSSSPFVVIDGVPGMDINSVAPQDIESISILKDASASAIYGSRSASGVILITTKKGKAGQATVNYNGYVTLDVVANKPRLLTADQWRKFTTDKGWDVSSLDKGGNTDWFDEIMRKGFSQNHQLSISGGTEKSNYRGSVSYLDRQGIMKDNWIKRFNALFSISQKALKNKLDLSFTGGYAQSDYSEANPNNSTLAYQMISVYPVRNEDGSLFEISQNGVGNPVQNLEQNSDLYKSSHLFTNLKADLEIVKGLTAGINLFKERQGLDHSLYNAISSPEGRGDNGFAYRGNELWDKSLLELTAVYSTSIGDHNFSILGGYSFEENLWQIESAQNRGFLFNDFGYNNLSAGENLFPSDVNSSKSMNRLISFFGRLNYSLLNRYILTATIRRDGSSKFGENNKWGTFPSASVAWRISEESFMSNVSFVEDLKLRASYGIVGNQDGIGPYKSIALYGRSDEYWDNGRWYNSYRYSQNANPDLKWEQTSSLNFGVDYYLLNDRLYGSFDIYSKKTVNLLYVYSVPVPPNLYPTILANVGDMSNKGFEAVINGDIIKQKNFRWTLSVNFAHNKNIITRLSNDIYTTSSIPTGEINLAGTTGLTSSIIEVDQEVGTFYGWRCLGLDEKGKFIIDDIEPDGILNNLDRTYIGHALPTLTYGISNTISFKGFDLNFFLNGVYGNDILNNPRLSYSNTAWLPGINVLQDALTNGINDSPTYSSYFIEKGSFLRLDNASLGYNFDLNNNLGIGACNVYFSVQNLFVITNYTGLDPEVTMSGLSPGVEEDSYIPKAKSFSLGISMNF
jgi:TonB-linked SusC/RagA family outer membrane protein